MAEIDRISLDAGASLPAVWSAVAARALAWAGDRRIALRDAIVLVPLAQHLAPARRAFAAAGGWLPRIETTRTLVAGLPPQPPSEGGISFDIAQDRLRAAQLLRERDGWLGAVGAQARGFEQCVARLVDTAHRFARHHASLPPAQRAAWAAQARMRLTPIDGAGATERLLARVALEWALDSAPWSSDVLYGLHPAAWIALRAGGVDPLADALLQSAQGPGLLLDADPPGADPIIAMPAASRVTCTACDDFEDEAERAAAQVLALLDAGHAPVVLVAQDRELVRRAAALLARQGVPVQDETGWKLSTTRAAASVMTLLRAAGRNASTDELLEWLKSLPRQALPGGRGAVDALEHRLRRAGCARVAALGELALPGVAAELRDWTLARLAPLSDGERRSLSQWLALLATLLHDSGQAPWLQADVAGQQVWRTLRLDGEGSGAWRALAQSLRLRFEEFVDAVDALLEQAVFEPPPDAQEPAVVITPLRRAVLRPFAAAVMPGADERRLGAGVAPDPLLGDTLAVALGLPSMALVQHDEAVAFAQLLRLPEVHLLHRHHDDGELLGASVFVRRLALQRERAGAPLQPAAELRVGEPVIPAPQQRPTPRAAGRLPAALSASAVEALRDCPYRFFARSVLRLQEPDELDEEAGKRDYGTWLHAVLLRFHADRPQPRSPHEDLAALQRCAEVEHAQAGLDAASFLPFQASFERFAPQYVDWLQARDAQGIVWLDGEAERDVAPDALDGLRLRGRLDRVDRVPGSDGEVHQLIDYKTVSVAGLRQRVRDPLEDTQLAFYAALELQGGHAPAALEAVYLALDDSSGIVTVPHDGVADSAQVLIEGLADELRRLRAGAPLPALGEGAVCGHCEARGLCRRDDWALQP
jgi:ATP-dependent helicase/nuclease subunit B